MNAAAIAAGTDAPLFLSSDGMHTLPALEEESPPDDTNAASASGHANGSSGRDVLEVIEDPAELLAKPLQRWQEQAHRKHAIDDGAARMSNSSYASSSLARDEGRAAKAPRLSSNGSAKPTPPHPPSALHSTRVAAPALPSHVGPASASPLSSSARSNGALSSGGVPVIGGSGARVPTQFLDGHGSFDRSMAQRQLREMQRPAVATLAPNPSAAAASSSKTIDLTADGSDDDDVVVVSSKRADPGVEVDERRSSAPVCIGMLQAVVTCVLGLPEICAIPAGMASSPHDVYFTKREWPQASEFWLQPGYRPIMFSLRQASALEGVARTTSGGWTSQGGGGGATPGANHDEVQVSSILPPGLVYKVAAQRAAAEGRPPPPPQERARAQPRMQSVFGALSHQFGAVMVPLLRTGAIRCEARCKAVPAQRASLFMHSIEVLIFTTRSNMATVANRFSAAGLQLWPPLVYQATDYPDAPEYVNLNLTVQPNRGGGGAAAGGQVWSDSNQYGTVVSKEKAEQERKRQIDLVYDTLKGGDQEEEQEPCRLVSTPLFPHQKRALSFLLDRERAKSFEAPTEIDLVNGGENDGSAGRTTVAKPRGAGEEEDIIALWKAVRGRNGKVRYYHNVVTQHDTSRKPELPRGSILADDMGLGKTITTIALIAHTLPEAADFSRRRLSRLRRVEADKAGGGRPAADSPTSTQEKRLDAWAGSEDGEEDEIRLVADAPKAVRAKPPAKSHRKREKEAEYRRRQQLEVRSSATLLVLPLTLVSGWEEQIREHWSDREQPSVYLYHGPGRCTDPAEVARYDIVITTYSTLAMEFGNQERWRDADESGEEGTPRQQQQQQRRRQTPPDDAEESEAGETTRTTRAAGGRGTGPKKGARRGGGGGGGRGDAARESANTLQRIEWFRVVLDEAHTIKEPRTRQARAVCNLSAQRRLCLTGTPVQNRIDDLYSLVKFLRLEPFVDREVWNAHCGATAGPGAGGGGLAAARREKADVLDETALAKVQTIMKYVALRRTKETRGADGSRILTLPPKRSRTVMLDFGRAERAKYAALHSRYREEFEQMRASDTLRANYATILHEISNLRLACDHEELVEESKDLRFLRDGVAVEAAISSDGITRARAKQLFEILASSDRSRCSECDVELSRAVVVTAASASASAADEGVTGAARRAVMTKCQHLFCSGCFASAAEGKWPDASAEDRVACPECGVVLGTLLEVVQLEPEDVQLDDAAGGAADEDDDGGGGRDARRDAVDRRARGGGGGGGAGADFGADADVPLDERRGLSTKIRALLAGLLPFSRCNPESLLYDPEAPLLDQRVVVVGDDDEADAAEHGGAGHADKGADGGAGGGGGGAGAGRGGAGETVRVVEVDKASDEAAKVRPVKSVVFSQWTKMLDRVRLGLERAGVGAARLDGRMTRQERAENLRRFRVEARVEVLLVSLKAGGVGLNLVSACRAYLMEPYWNPATENQGLDRVHRLGQHRPVVTTKFVMKNSIETAMLEIQRRKMLLAQRVGERRQTQQQVRDGELALLFGATGGGDAPEEEPSGRKAKRDGSKAAVEDVKGVREQTGRDASDTKAAQEGQASEDETDQLEESDDEGEDRS